MQITHYNPTTTTKALRTHVETLEPFLLELSLMAEKDAKKSPYSALWQWQDEKMLHEVMALVTKFQKPKHVVLVGTGGSSLGTEAIHAVLDNDKTAQLHILDTLAPHETKAVFSYLSKVKKVEDIVVCVVSKSGKTTETLLNAEVVLEQFRGQFGKDIYTQTIFISAPKARLKKIAKKLGAHHISTPEVVSGRYSVMTPVGLVPLALLGHDIEAILSGYTDAATEEYVKVAADQAAFIFDAAKRGPGTLQLFVFDTRLVRFAKWYRQLFAESLGKARTTKKKAVQETVLVPAISSPVELHSMGQLYFSGITNTYTECFNFNDAACDFAIGASPKVSLEKRTSLEAGRRALHEGTFDAYQAAQLPYVEYFCDESLGYSMGLLMGLKMYTVVCLAELMEVDPFDQPAVEDYKKRTTAHLRKKK